MQTLLMYKIFFVLLASVFFHGCAGQITTASIMGSGASIISGASVSKTVLTSGTNLYIEKKTGKSTFKHVADNTIDAELRNCEIDHSAEINQIFFVTLDQFDCVLK